MAKQKRLPNLPDNNRVARRCGHQKIDRDPETLEVRGIIPQAIALRTEIAESYLSTSWLEYYDGGDERRLKSVAETYRTAGVALRPSAGLALLCVGKILAAGRERSRELRVIHRRNRDDPAYARIEGMPLDNSDMVLLQMICGDACERVVLIRDLDAG